MPLPCHTHVVPISLLGGASFYSSLTHGKRKKRAAEEKTTHPIPTMQLLGLRKSKQGNKIYIPVVGSGLNHWIHPIARYLLPSTQLLTAEG